MSLGQGVYGFSNVQVTEDMVARNTLFPCRFDYSTSTKCQLTPFDGDSITFSGGRTQKIDSSLTRYQVTTTQNTITSTGQDSGSSLSASTLYYAYLGNNLARPFPEELRLSTTNFTRSNATHGLPLLGAAGNALNWLCVGSLYTTSGTLFNFSTAPPAQLFVASLFNRRYRSGVGVFTANRSVTSTSYTEINSEIRVEFVCWGDRADITLAAGGQNNDTVAAFTSCAVGDASSQYGGPSFGHAVLGSYYQPFACFHSGIYTAGYNYATLYGLVSSGTGTWKGAATLPQTALQLLTFI